MHEARLRALWFDDQSRQNVSDQTWNVDLGQGVVVLVVASLVFLTLGVLSGAEGRVVDPIVIVNLDETPVLARVTVKKVLFKCAEKLTKSDCDCDWSASDIDLSLGGPFLLEVWYLRIRPHAPVFGSPLATVLSFEYPPVSFQGGQIGDVQSIRVISKAHSVFWLEKMRLSFRTKFDFLQYLSPDVCMKHNNDFLFGGMCLFAYNWGNAIVVHHAVHQVLKFLVIWNFF